MTICPACGDAYERVASHWSNSACGYPQISVRQRAVLDGLVLGGANVDGQGSNRHLLASTTSESLAEWTADQLDWLHHGTRTDHDDAADHQDVCRVRTPAHPAINRYERWGDGETRAPPDDYELTPLAGRVWWAYAGGLQWQGDYDSQRTATISALDDDRGAWVQRVLATAGIDATRTGKRVQWHGQQLRDWLDWIGDPVPGAEHKWATRVEYRALRERPSSASEYEAAIARHALQVAHARTEDRLTSEAFDHVGEQISAERVADILGGGSFADACSVAGVPTRSKPASNAAPQPSPDAPSRWTSAEVEEIVDTWAAQAAKLTYDEYHDYSKGREDIPSVSWFYQDNTPYDGFRDAIAECLDRDPPKVPGTEYWTREQAASAIADWLGTLDTPDAASSGAYREFESGQTDYPALSRVYELFDGWNDAVTVAVERDETMTADSIEVAGSQTVEACPDCDSSTIMTRKTKTPLYRCGDCSAEFAEPVERDAKRGRTVDKQ
jgi:ribosomal protein S27AE